MLGWVLRLVLLLIVVRLVWRFFAGVVDGIAGPGRVRGPVGAAPGPVPLVKDPVCGTYVVREKALTAWAGGHTVWFCSERCREQWLAGRGAPRP
jgi:YHS domain-containing protein